MRRLLLGIIPLLVLVPAHRADDKPKKKPNEEKSATQAEQYKALTDELRKLAQETRKTLEEAKTGKERDQIIAGYRKKLGGFVSRLLALAEKEPKSEEGFGALLTAVTLAGDSPEADKAVALLLAHHGNDKKLGQACMELADQQAPGAEKLCRAVLEKGKDKKAQVFACLGLARLTKSKAENPGVRPAAAAKLNKEAEGLYDRVVKDYAGVKDAVKIAEKELFPIRHLVIGKEAPEIEGEDSDGKKFKLSDYRGKVVVLDFWASW
jgi:AhpC/TSA family